MLVLPTGKYLSSKFRQFFGIFKVQYSECFENQVIFTNFEPKSRPYMKKSLLAFLLYLIVPFSASADIFEDISRSLRTGNATLVAGFFAPSIDMAILSEENMYSKNQAEQVLKDFFSKNPPKSFSIIHRGSSGEGALYAIGTYESSNGSVFRTYFFVKQGAGKNLIHEMRIERE